MTCTGNSGNLIKVVGKQCYVYFKLQCNNWRCGFRFFVLAHLSSTHTLGSETGLLLVGVEVH